MGEIKKGVLKSFTPKMNNGAHETYESPNGTLYIYMVTMNIDGVDEVGEAKGKTNKGAWAVGTNYKFERDVRGAQGQFISYKGFTKLDESGAPVTRGGGGGNYGGAKKSNGNYAANKLEFAIQKAVECAYNTTHKFWLVMGRTENGGLKPSDLMDYKKPVSKFLKFLVQEKTEASIWLRIASLNILCQREDVIAMGYTDDKKRIDIWIEQAFITLEHVNQYITENSAPDGNQ